MGKSEIVILVVALVSFVISFLFCATLITFFPLGFFAISAVGILSFTLSFAVVGLIAHKLGF